MPHRKALYIVWMRCASSDSVGSEDFWNSELKLRSDDTAKSDIVVIVVVFLFSL